MRIFEIFKTKCRKCPCGLGLLRFIINPCPMCKMNNYNMYYQLLDGKCMSIRNRIIEIQHILENNSRIDRKDDHQ